MRVVPLFIAITLIGCVFAEPAAKPKNEIVTAVHKAGEALSKIQLKSPFASFTGKQEMHAFKAEQSSSCDLTAYSTATATALQSCPGLVKVMAGTGTALEFLPGFCGSDCHKAIVAQMPKLAGCDGYSSTVRTMQELVKGCATKPRCYTEAFLKTQDSLEKRCSNEIDAITNFNNFTAAGVNATRSACQGTCITEVAAAMRTYPECVTDSDSTVSPTAMASLMEGLCQQENGEYCGVRMKAIGKLSCSSGSACYSSTSSLSWCSLNNPYSLYSCTPVVNDERLSSFCGSCVANLQKNAAAFGDNADTVVSSLNLYCSLANGTTFNNVTNPYCYPLAMNAYNVVNSWYQPSNSTVASACAGAASQCAELTLNVAADIATSAAKKSFASCLYGYSSGSYCQSTYESSLRSAATSRAFAARVCAQNEKKDWCVTSLNNVYNAYSYCSYLGTASYRTALNTSIAAAGCCMGYYNDFQRYSSYSYAASYLPSGTRVQPYQTYQYTTSSYTTATKLYNYTHPTLYSRSTIRRDEQPANQLFYCLSTTGNTTDFWNVVEKQCTTTYLASPPTASVPVMISWTRISRNPAVKAAVEAAMRSDVAKAIGVALRSIVNGTLIENAAATIYLRNESTLSRRQAQTTDHGATYQFQVDQPTSADATAAIARLNSQVSAGTFVTTSTSATVQTQCGECIDSRSDSLIKSAETPATPAPVGISSPSSAGAVAVASAVAAAFALVAAL